MQPTLLAEYLLPPGVCFLCRASRRRDELIVDTGLMVDANMGDPNSPDFGSGVREEPVVICGSCIAEMGSMVGMAGTAKVAELTERLVGVSAELEQVSAERDDLLTAVEALRRAGFAAPEVGRFVCGESDCERVFTTRHALGVHVGKSHKELSL